MRFIPTEFQGLFVIEPTVHSDERGFFLETFREELFVAQGLAFKALQANQAFSAAAGVARSAFSGSAQNSGQTGVGNQRAGS